MVIIFAGGGGTSSPAKGFSEVRFAPLREKLAVKIVSPDLALGSLQIFAFLHKGFFSNPVLRALGAAIVKSLYSWASHPVGR